MAGRWITTAPGHGLVSFEKRSEQAEDPLSPAATLRERARIAANEGRTLGADYASWARINLACAPDVASRIVERVLGLL